LVVLRILCSYFCVICVYMSLLIFRHSWCFPLITLALYFHCIFFGYNLTRCTFSYQTLFFFWFSGPVVFPSWLYLVVYVIVACIACSFTIACLGFDAYVRMSGVRYESQRDTIVPISISLRSYFHFVNLDAVLCWLVSSGGDVEL
jgi:hypothetical protein